METLDLEIQEIKRTANRKGWLLPYLIALDEMFYGRWKYWTEIIESNKLTDEPIPQIPFQSPESYSEKLVSKNIKDCLDRAVYKLSDPLHKFVDWMLWGFGTGEVFPNIPKEIDDYWYRNFNLGLFYKEPADHWSMVTMDFMGKNNGLGFFPTPASVVSMMVQMTFGEHDPEKHKTLSVMEPCCGTGIILLYASNYSLNLYGNDVSLLLVKIAKINSYIYIPWLAYRPDNLTVLD